MSGNPPSISRGGYSRARLARALKDLDESGFLPYHSYGGGRADRESMMDRTSALIRTFVVGTSVDSSGELSIPERLRAQVDLLKEVTGHFVIEQPRLATVQRGQRRVVRELFEGLSHWVEEAGSTERDLRGLPRRLGTYLRTALADPELAAELKTEAAIRGRVVCDYLASLTEDQALRLHQRLMGASDSAMEKWLDS